jgi:hypothetical protein
MNRRKFYIKSLQVSSVVLYFFSFLYKSYETNKEFVCLFVCLFVNAVYQMVVEKKMHLVNGSKHID